MIGGKSKYRVMDEKVRYFVGPGVEVLRETSVSLVVSDRLRNLGSILVEGTLSRIPKLIYHFDYCYIQLRPYVSAKEMQDNPPLPTRYNASNPPLSFSPNAYHASLLVPRHSAPSSSASSSSSLSSPSSTTTSSPLPTTAADSDSTTPQTDASKPLRIKAHDTKSFSKWYRDLPFEERNKLVQETRKNWYLEMVKRGK